MPNSPRARERLAAARKEVATCAISGAVGTFAQIDPAVEAHVAKTMGLAVEPISTQVIPRDRHAMYFATLAVVAASIERLATEIRHLQRTEVLEAEEYFSPGQKGSSAMPHKRNPVLSENLTGLARMVRAYVTPALENVALWHERDISHSSVERMIGPDATVTLDFALHRLAGLIDKLVVYPENMKKNLDRLGGLVHSQRVLLALTQKGAPREDAYRLVQRNAMKVWQEGGDFLDFAQGRSGGAQVSHRGRARREFRPRLPPQGGRHDLRAGVRDGRSGCGMKPRVKSKRLLRPQRISSGRVGADEDEIPTVGRYCAWDEYELVLGQQSISEHLLTGAGNAGSQPVRVGNGRRLDNVHI